MHLFEVYTHTYVATYIDHYIPPSKFADEDTLAYDDNNNNSTALVKPESILPDFSQDIIKVNSWHHVISHVYCSPSGTGRFPTDSIK